MSLNAFFKEIDERWEWPQEPKLRLSIIGSTALMLQTSYARGTKDSDVLETAHLIGETKDRLLALAGKGTALSVRRALYIEIVASGLPFLPQAPLYHPRVELNASLSRFEIEVLDVVDVVVSKLKRFHANDQSDIRAMIAKGLVPHERLVARFRSAVDMYEADARADELHRYVTNLHRIERDELDVAETEIDLPAWV